MAAALIATACSKLVCREGVYHALSKRYLETARMAPRSNPPD
jgi:hypothetical protein